MTTQVSNLLLAIVSFTLIRSLHRERMLFDELTRRNGVDTTDYLSDNIN